MSRNREVFVAKTSYFYIFVAFLILLSVITTTTRAATTAITKSTAASTTTITTRRPITTTASITIKAITTTAIATTTAITKTTAASTTTSASYMLIASTATTRAIPTTPAIPAPSTTMPVGLSSITIDPPYGPMAGGTAVTIVTTWTRPNILIAAVYIGSNQQARILSQTTSTDYISSNNTAFVISPSITDESLIDKPLQIILEINPYFGNVYSRMYFTYKRNATIYDVNPRVMPLSGGIHLTVTGSNLASASNSVIRAVVTVWRNNSQPSRNESFGPCYQPNENGTQMICLSPPIYIPQDFLLYLFGQTDQYSDVYRRRKREDIFGIDWLKGHPLTLRSRIKRSLSIQTNQTYVLPSTRDSMQVSMYAVSDGLQLPLEVVGDIQLRNPPSISCANNIYFDSKDSATITITGNGMSACCGKSDYTVRIGNGFCNVTDLTDNELKCEPPKDKPQQTDSDTRYCGENFAVFIDVGYRNYRCSCLEYVDNRKTILIIIIAVTVGSALLIFIAIVVIAICVRRSRTPEKSPIQEDPIRNPLTERRGVVMMSRQPNDIGSLQSNGTGSSDPSPEGYFNRLPRPGYNTRPTNQSDVYHYQNSGNLGYARSIEDDLDRMHFPYSRNG